MSRERGRSCRELGDARRRRGESSRRDGDSLLRPSVRGLGERVLPRFSYLLRGGGDMLGERCGDLGALLCCSDSSGGSDTGTGSSSSRPAPPSASMRFGDGFFSGDSRSLPG